MSQDKTEQALVLREQAANQLAQIKSIESGTEYLSKVKGIEAWAKAEKQDAEMMTLIAEQKLRTQRILGQLIKQGRENGEIRMKGQSNPSSDSRSYDDLGLEQRSAHRWQQIASIPEPAFNQFIEQKKAEVQEKAAELTTAGMLKFKKQLDLEQKKQEKEDEVKSAIKNKPFIYLRDAFEWVREIPEYDLLLTDPPYSTDVDDIEKFAASWLPSYLSKMKSTGRAYVFIGSYPRELKAYLDACDVQDVLVWTYRNTLGPTPKNRYKRNWQAVLYFEGEDAAPLDCIEMVEQFSVQDVSAPDGRQADRYHAWQKPLKLVERFIRHSTRPGDLVVDPFACTGSHLLAAASLGRRSMGCEINEDNMKIAIQRGCYE